MGSTGADIDSTAAVTLGQALRDGVLPACHGRVLFLRAHPASLHPSAGDGWTCVQSFRPLARELECRGCPVLREAPVDVEFDLALVLPPRQRDEARASLARAVASVRRGGCVVAAVANRDGARSIEKDLERLIGGLESFSRHKCRVFRGRVDAECVDCELLEAWLALDAPRPILDGRFVSRPGLFAWDRIDDASALLVENLPETLAGRVADLGAGYGYLSAEILRRCPGVTALDLYEAEARALEVARVNIDRERADSGRDVPVTLHWHDVVQGLPQRYDAVVSNPPFHQGRADRPELGQAFVDAAADALEPGGVLWMVANRHLPYEAILQRRFPHVRNVAEHDGFKVLFAQRGPDRAS